MAWAALTGLTPSLSSSPGAKEVTNSASCFLFAASAPVASRIASASRRLSPRRICCSLVSPGRPRRRAINSRCASVIAGHSSRSVSSPANGNARAAG